MGERFLFPRSKFVYCEACGRRLSYERGSIAHRSKVRHICPTCAGREAGKRIAERFRENLKRRQRASE